MALRAPAEIANVPATPKLPETLEWGDAFRFPIDTPEGRRDIVIGALVLLFLLPLGWILNLGNRLNVVDRLYRGERPYFTGFRPLADTFRRGCVSFAAILVYLSPAVAAGTAAFLLRMSGAERLHYVLAATSAALFVLGVFTLPGGMTVYAAERDLTVLLHPTRAFRRAWARRRPYGRAWAIAVTAVLASFLGLLALGVGFLFASVWSWEVVGYAFTVALYGKGEDS